MDFGSAFYLKSVYTERLQVRVDRCLMYYLVTNISAGDLLVVFLQSCNTGSLISTCLETRTLHSLKLLSLSIRTDFSMFKQPSANIEVL